MLRQETSFTAKDRVGDTALLVEWVRFDSDPDQRDYVLSTRYRCNAGYDLVKLVREVKIVERASAYAGAYREPGYRIDDGRVFTFDGELIHANMDYVREATLYELDAPESQTGPRV